MTAPDDVPLKRTSGDDDEVHRVVADWKKRGEPLYIDGLLDEGSATPVTPGEIKESAGWGRPAQRSTNPTDRESLTASVNRSSKRRPLALSTSSWPIQRTRVGLSASIWPIWSGRNSYRAVENMGMSANLRRKVGFNQAGKTCQLHESKHPDGYCFRLGQIGTHCIKSPRVGLSTGPPWSSSTEGNSA